MNFGNQKKIKEWFRSQDIENVGEKVYILKRKQQGEGNYITLNFETLKFGAVEQYDLITVQIYSQSNLGPGGAEDIADKVLEIFPGENLELNYVSFYQIVPTTRTPAFSIKNQYKVTLFFQARYLV